MAQLELRRHVELQEKNQRILKDYQDKLERMNALLQKQSVTDDVTGFYNTRFLHQYLDQCLSPTSAELEKLTLVFFDMDNFKQVVDKHGHLLGAKVLRGPDFLNTQRLQHHLIFVFSQNDSLT